MAMTVRNPVEWGVDQIRQTFSAVRSAEHAFHHPAEEAGTLVPQVRRITLADLREVLIKGFSDFGAYRTDVIFICVLYPLAGLLIGAATLGSGLLPLLFPLISGFALLGPLAAAGLYEMSRQREQGKDVNWNDAFAVFSSPSLAAIIELGLLLVGIFLVWLLVAMGIYQLTLGPDLPDSVSSFATEVFTTGPGWALIVLGVGVGFLFAVLVLAISVVSFPLLLDHRVGVSVAVRTSIRAFMLNPIPMLAWGLIVAGGLVLGAIPLLVGLVVVMPVLGHATWHLYRKVVQ
jgi:uncharacterized membrane protein